MNDTEFCIVQHKANWSKEENEALLFQKYSCFVCGKKFDLGSKKIIEK